MRLRGKALAFVSLLVLAGVVRESDITRDPLLLVNYLKTVTRTQPEVGWLCVVTPGGRIQASNDLNLFGMERKAVNVPPMLDVMTEPVDYRGANLGHVEVGFDRRIADAQLRGSLHQLIGRLAVLGGFTLIIGLICSFLLARDLTEPIGKLSEAAASLTEGKEDVPLEIQRADELGDLARSFEEMRTRLKELDRMKDDFVHSTTHELRTPLGAIEAHANAIIEDLEAARDNPPANLEDWLSSLSHIKQNCARLGRFVNAMLDLAKIERGKMEINPRDISLSEIVEEVALFFNPQIEERGIHLLRRIPPELPLLLADPDALHQVFANLIGNAIKFTPQGGQIEITAEEVFPHQARIQVSDTGPGIPREFMGKLFGKFEQAKDRPKSSGTGLGLAICKALVELHGGKIGAVSRLGRGSTFFFTLPLAGPEPVYAERAAGEESAQTA
ncbi:MAG: HAMP domain-containing sensor histidine kinase [Elusimicrobia bacterium]|nr:HAMP domain-containing sensor histidine kinase [Elusimicrobiota bacterium]